MVVVTTVHLFFVPEKNKVGSQSILNPIYENFSVFLFDILYERTKTQQTWMERDVLVFFLCMFLFV